MCVCVCVRVYCELGFAASVPSLSISVTNVVENHVSPSWHLLPLTVIVDAPFVTVKLTVHCNDGSRVEGKLIQSSTLLQHSFYLS